MDGSDGRPVGGAGGHFDGGRESDPDLVSRFRAHHCTENRAAQPVDTTAMAMSGAQLRTK